MEKEHFKEDLIDLSLSKQKFLVAKRGKVEGLEGMRGRSGGRKDI